MNWRIAQIGAAIAAIGVLAAGCSSGDENGVHAIGSAGAGSALAGEPANESAVQGGPESLSFELQGDLLLAAGEATTIAIEASPPGVYELRVSLLNEAQDASLDRGRVTTDADGLASVELTAPTTNTTFTLRVSAGDVIVETGVSVETVFIAALTVQPLYEGERETPTWAAEAYRGLSCRDLATSPPTADFSVEASEGDALVFDELPAGEPFAISLKSQGAVSGCADVEGLPADEHTVVDIEVYDVPAQVDETALDLRFDVDTDFNAWRDGLSYSIQPIIDSVFANPGNDSRMLLDTMARALTLQSAQAFADARLTHGWDASMRGLWGANSSTRISDTLSQWLVSGVANASGTEVFVGTLDLVTNPDAPTIPLTTLDGVDAKQAALATPVDVELEIESSSSLLLGARFYWQPSRLLAALGWDAVSAANPEVATAPEALANQLDCAQVARTLVDATGSTSAFEGCDEDCLALTCLDACDLIWIALRGASAQRSSAATLDWTARASAVVNADSQLVSFEGTWVGTLAIEGTTVSLRGAVSGS